MLSGRCQGLDLLDECLGKESVEVSGTASRKVAVVVYVFRCLAGRGVPWPADLRSTAASTASSLMQS